MRPVRNSTHLPLLSGKKSLVGIKVPNGKSKAKWFYHYVIPDYLKEIEIEIEIELEREREREGKVEGERETIPVVTIFILRHEKLVINEGCLCFSQRLPNSPLLLHIAQPPLWLDLILAIGIWTEVVCHF